MSNVTRFEDLEAWKLGRELTMQVYSMTRESAMGRDYRFVDQMRSASVSIMNNVAEGFERGSNKDFAKFVFIARASAGEVRSMLYVALDQGYITPERFKDCFDLSVRCSQVCWGLIKHLQRASAWKTGLNIWPFLICASLAADCRITP